MQSRRAEGGDRVFVGVDAGGSSTRAVVVDADGTVLGYGTGPAGNPTSSGIDGAATGVVASVGAALDSVGEPLIPLRIAVAMAGASTAPEGWLLPAFADAGIRGEVVIEADLAALYLSGSRARLGYALIAGTGAIAARMRDHAIEKVSDGLGWLLGDDGSGFWIGHRAVRAVAAELDGRGPATSMTPEVLGDLTAATGAAVDLHRPDVLDRVMSAAYGDRPVRLARFAPLAFRAADAGDPVAAEIVAEGARILARTLGAVLDDTHRDAPVVLGGSVLAGQERMSDAVRAALARRAVTGSVVTVQDGVVGAAVLALEGAGIAVDDAIAERVRSGLADRR